MIPILMMSLLIFVTLGTQTSYAAENVAEKCGYEPRPGVNPSYQMTNCLLTEMALTYDIPPEVVKGVAHMENSSWAQFNANGEAIESFDGGIGLMQVTLYQHYDINRLKNDLVYNIQAGVEILNSMFTRGDLPKINDHERNIIEHWYFAMMAYNGTMPINSPVIQSSGERNSEAYQERVFDLINEYHLLSLARIPFEPSDFQYDPEAREPIQFVTKHVETNQALTKSSYYFEPNEYVQSTTTRLQLRENPTSSSKSLSTINEGEVITITGDFTYDSNPQSRNHFVWYPATKWDGTSGYVASSYLEASDYVESPEKPVIVEPFPDVPLSHWGAEAIYFLTEQGIIKGYPNGYYGVSDSITRAQAATLLVRSENLSMDNRPNPNFQDVPTNHPYYDAIAAAVDEGIFSGVTATQFQPNEQLTRAQMAVLLNRLYTFEEPTIDHPFTDVPAGAWYEDDVHTLYSNRIVAGKTQTTYAPNSDVTRAEFAVFMHRVMTGNNEIVTPA